VSIEDLDSKAAAANCAAKVRCGLTPDQASCEATVAISAEDLTLVADVESGKVTYDASAAGRCLDDVSSLSCEEFITGGSDSQYEDCSKIFTGTVAAGGSCYVDEDCVSDECDPNTCDPSAACCEGTCAAVTPTVADGAACTLESYCVAGDECTNGTCQKAPTIPPIADGQPCDLGDVCANGDVCEADSTGAMTCQRIGKAGDACSQPSFQQTCDYGLYCDSASSTCKPLVAVGGSCASGVCVAYATCDSTTSECVADALLGQDCSSTPCLGDATCDPTTRKCTLPTTTTCAP
jgi:hypothetical protein